MFAQNRAGLVFSAISISIAAIYLIALGTFMGYGATGEGEFTMIFGFVPFLMILDFFFRLSLQQTPSILAKPYSLLPVRQQDVITCFLATSLYSTLTLVWFFLWIPYLFICICGGLSWPAAIGMACVLYLLCAINGLWYLLIRTLANRHVSFWAIPVILDLLMVSPFLLDTSKGFERLVHFCSNHGFKPYAIVIYLLVFVLLFVANQRVQLNFTKQEIARKDDIKLKHISRFSFLEKWGVTGEYLKLEIKAALRCKNLRSRYLQGLYLIVMFSCLIAYTDIYDGAFSQNGLCLYCFLFFGAVNLVKVMCPEGNFIDLLMVNKENILTLLRAKYYFYCAVLLLPTLLLLPALLSGKFTWLMMAAYLLFTAGPLYGLLFQLAVYNKQALPLNEKVTGKNKMENTLQLIASLVAFVTPVVFNAILRLFFSDTTAYTVMAAIGLLFVLTHEYWLRNIYNRMMRRRYENLNGFHASR